MEKKENLPLKNKFKILKHLGCNYYIGNIPLFNNPSKITTIEDIPLYINKISKHGKKPTIIFKSISAGSLGQKLSLFLKNDFNPENEVIIDSRIPQLFRLSSKNNEKFDIIPLKESSGYGKYQVNTRKPGIMVFPGNWASGWKAWINNKKTQVFESNIFLKVFSFLLGRIN